MDLFKTIETLVKFKTETGSAAEIDKCLDFIASCFEGTDAVVQIERFKEASPVIFIRNNNDMMQDALVLGHIDVVKADDKMFEPLFNDINEAKKKRIKIICLIVSAFIGWFIISALLELFE